jgi:hypothetical protein
MVQIIPANERPHKQTFAQKLNLGVGRGLEQASEMLKSHQENKTLKEKYGIDLEGIENPNTRAQIIADHLKSGRGLSQAKASAGIDYSTYIGDQENPSKPSRGQELGFEKKSGETFENISTSKGKRSIPVTKPVMNLEQIMKKAHQITNEKLQNNIPTDFQSELNTLNSINEAAKYENQEIKAKQQEYGNKYVEKLSNVMENPNDEIVSLFQKKGENGYMEGLTEGEINADAAIQARKFKNTIANVSKDLNSLILRGFDKSSNAIKNKVQPLLDEGLYDTTRNLLDKGGAYPEQIEKIVSNLGEIPKKTVASYEKQQRPDRSWWESQDLTDFDIFSTRYQHNKAPYAPEQMEVIKSNIKDALTNDPATNLILLREAYSNKDVEWDEFKNILDELMIKGEIKLNDDQFNMLDTLDQPPLSGLEKFLKNIRLM